VLTEPVEFLRLNLLRPIFRLLGGILALVTQLKWSPAVPYLSKLPLITLWCWNQDTPVECYVPLHCHGSITEADQKCEESDFWAIVTIALTKITIAFCDTRYSLRGPPASEAR